MAKKPSAEADAPRREDTSSERKAPEAKKAEGKAPEAKKTEGKGPEGKKAEGKAPEGKKGEGKKGEGKSPEGKGKGAPKAEAKAEAPAEAPASRRGKAPGKSPRRGKKLRNKIRNDRQKVSKEGTVPLPRGLTLLKQIKRAKFDETVEIHISLGIDPTQSDQMIRGSVSLPHGVGKAVRVLVFCQGDNVAKAEEGGADYAGSDELIKKIQGEGWLEFDVALATQDMMAQVSRLGKILGPRGLMPTPRAGTVITMGGDVTQAVREFKAGKVEYRSDRGGNVHAGVGKMSFEDNLLAENITTFVDQIRAVKPTGVKGNYIKSITVAGTMTPGVPVTL